MSNFPKVGSSGRRRSKSSGKDARHYDSFLRQGKKLGKPDAEAFWAISEVKLPEGKKLIYENGRMEWK